MTIKFFSIILIFFQLILFTNNKEREWGIAIKRSKFIKTVNMINIKLEIKDTNVLTKQDCIEILRISNSLRIYGTKCWIKTKNDSIIVKKFETLYGFPNPFRRELESYFTNLGKVEASDRFGVYYSDFDVYMGGGKINDNSLYRKNRSFMDIIGVNQK